MKRIDILVSSSEDVQKERIVAEQLIRRVATESGVPVTVSYSGWSGRSKPKDETGRAENGKQENGLLLCPLFRERQDPAADLECSEDVLNPGQYDLVISILWSQLGIRSAPMFVMPDGSQPGSATEYEVAWVLDQSKITLGFPELHVYRNRAAPAALLEPKEERENLCRHWDAVQEFWATWEKNGETEFHDCCHEYRDLEEFEDLFREHFREFLARQLAQQIDLGKAQRKVRYSESNPFLGLNYFDFEHAALYHGRTKAIWEVLDALKNQAMAGNAFVLILGPAGSGKSSLVRAGVLPLLAQGRTPVGKGPWRCAVTQPGTGGDAGDPFDRLAAALLGKFALPELRDHESTIAWGNLASRLRKDPDAAAGRIAAALDQLTRSELNNLETRKSPGKRSDGAGVVRQENLGGIRPRVRLALVVDQLEELFGCAVSPVLQRNYTSALGALAKCDGVHIIATLRTGFYADCQQFPELIELTALSGRYDLQPPTPRGIRNIIRLRAEAAGLRFERAPDTGRRLDEALVEEAIAGPEPLLLLEHLLSRLYQRQLDRKDGLLRWSDYRGLGEFQGALVLHEKNVFSTLERDEQRALKFVIRQLVELGRGEEDHLILRNVPYSDLFSSPELDQRQRIGAIGLVDRLVKEGLLCADDDPEQGLLIRVPQEALLRRWPEVWQWISESRHFFQMRDRLDANLRLWLSGGCHRDHLLGRGIGLTEARTLLRDFGQSLNEEQIEYIRKSLGKQNRRRWVRDGLAVIAVLVVLTAFAGIGRFNTESKRKNRKQEIQLAQQNANLAVSQRSALQAQLEKAEEKARLAQQNADLANNQRSALETQLRKAQEEKAQLAQLNTNLTDQSSALQTQVKQVEEKAQTEQQNTELGTSQRETLETELQKAQEEIAQLAKQNANLTSQVGDLQTQLKQIEEKAQAAQQTIDLATKQRDTLQTELDKTREEKAQLEQRNTGFASSQQNTSEPQLKKAKGKNANLVNRKRQTQQTQRKKAKTTSRNRTKKRSKGGSTASEGAETQ